MYCCGHYRSLSKNFFDYSIGRDQQELIEECSEIYVVEESLGEDTPRQMGDIASDCCRDWSARHSTEDGIVIPAHELDPVFIRERTRPLLKVLTSRLNYAGIPALAGAGGRFLFPTARKKVVNDKLLPFYKFHVPAFSPIGFIGCYFHLELSERLARFTAAWMPKDLEELEADDLRRLARLISDIYVSLSSGTAARRVLDRALAAKAISLGDTAVISNVAAAGLM